MGANVPVSQGRLSRFCARRSDEIGCSGFPGLVGGFATTVRWSSRRRWTKSSQRPGKLPTKNPVAVGCSKLPSRRANHRNSRLGMLRTRLRGPGEPLIKAAFLAFMSIWSVSRHDLDDEFGQPSRILARSRWSDLLSRGGPHVGLQSPLQGREVSSLDPGRSCLGCRSNRSGGPSSWCAVRRGKVTRPFLK